MLLKERRKISQICAALLLWFSSPAVAATIFDSGEPAPVNGLFSLFNLGPDNFQDIAARFTISQTSTITRIEVFFLGAPVATDQTFDQFIVSVHRNSAIGVPGDVIASQVRIVPRVFDDGRNIGWAGGFTEATLVLGPGDYWASFSVDPNNPARCGCALLSGAQTVVPIAAFRNNFSFMRWQVAQASFGFRVFGDPLLSAVPEPSSWAMLIIGFGFVGGGLRKRWAQPPELTA